MEQLLHYVWKYKIFPLTELRTSTGASVEVIDPGLSNMHAGPDFFNAKIKIDGTLWVGNVEIHSISSDWYKHNHHTDKAYDSVILHIASEVNEDVRRSDGVAIPQLKLECPEHIRLRYDELRQADMRPPCYSILPSLPKLTVHSWFSALQAERFEQKTAVIKERLKKLDNHWEDTFFITLARNFGFGVNGDAFETWANLLSFRAIDKHRDNAIQIEAFFFGQAGLLDEDLKEDAYYAELQKEYRFLKHKFELKQMDATLWRFLRMRPGNFPHIRIAQLAYLYGRERGLFSQIVDAKTVSEIRQILSVQTSLYWKERYIFGKKSPGKDKTLGKGSLDLIVINTVVPFLYAYGLYKGDEQLCDKATSFLEEVKAEKNYITRMWDGAGLPVNTAADSQALIQLQKEYCDKKKCLYCRFGYEYLRKIK
ncbi:DUF2851 family protein [Bacteroides sp. 224]|uniref:DUF2851 family protein n=1 Tax=Bacteroides sp. 224 TaxID=2302936 RepID=UPI0013D50732|nr:DUF2851 family protein [Bacteroides sp. 224]NDV65485.1 DUF2851 family protein [Bacteroides sp. 224]